MFLPLNLGETGRRGHRNTLGVNGMENTRGTWPTEWTNLDACGIKVEATRNEPACVFTRSSLYILWLLASSFCGTPNGGYGCLQLFCLLLVVFFSCSVALSRCDVGLCLIYYILIFCFVLPGHWFLKFCSFLVRDRGELNQGKEDVWSESGRRTV